MTRIKRALGIISLLVAAVPILGSGALRVFEPSLVFKPKPYPVGNWSPSGPKPTDVWFTAKDGTRLNGWYMPSKNPRAVILYFHGNAGNVTDRYAELVQLHDRFSASVLIFDYRGFGRSEGKPDEQGILRDAEAARAWLASTERVSPQELVLMGRSLGGGVAVDLASRFGAKGLILVSTFLSLPETVSSRYPFLAASWVMQNRFDSIHKIAAFHGPLFESHGDADETIPFQHGERLFASATGPKWFLPIRGGRHFDPISDEIYRGMGDFLDRIHTQSVKVGAL